MQPEQRRMPAGSRLRTYSTKFWGLVLSRFVQAKQAKKR